MWVTRMILVTHSGKIDKSDLAYQYFNSALFFYPSTAYFFLHFAQLHPPYEGRR